MQADIKMYHRALAKNDKVICDLLKKEIESARKKRQGDLRLTEERN